MPLRFLMVPSLTLLAACAHAAAARAPVQAPTDSTSAVSASELVTPSDAVSTTQPEAVRSRLLWTLRLADDAAWQTMPTTLHTFSVGRWECAMGVVQQDEQTPPARASRRLACTHVSGATVQTQLTCPGQPTQTSDATRELELVLDTSPTVRLACAPASAGMVETR